MQPQLTILWQCFMGGNGICDDVAWSTRGATKSMAIKWGFRGALFSDKPKFIMSSELQYTSIYPYKALIPTIYQLYTNYIPTIYQLYTNYIPTIYQLYTNYTLSNLMKAMLISEKAQTEIWLRPWPILQLVVSTLLKKKKTCSFFSL